MKQIVKQTKNQTFVYLYALAIIMVIDDHCGTCIGINSKLFPYNSSYMPLFVFCSGYFFKQRKPEDAIAQKIRRLLIPYIIYDAVMTGLACIVDSTFHTKWYRSVTVNSIVRMLAGHPTTDLNGAAWFAIMLFWVSVIYLFLYDLAKKLVRQDARRDCLLTGLFTMCAFASLYICIYKPDYVSQPVRWGCKTAFFLQFYHLGHMFRTYFETILQKQSKSLVCLSCIVINGILIILFGDAITFPATVGMKNFHYITLPLVTSITGILFYYEVMSFLAENIGERKAVSFISNNTFVIMQVHLLFVNIPNLYMYYAVTHGSAKFQDFPTDAVMYSTWERYGPRSNLIAFFCGVFGSLLVAYAIEQSKSWIEKSIHLPIHLSKG